MESTAVLELAERLPKAKSADCVTPVDYLCFLLRRVAGYTLGAAPQKI
jgi:hypothetical protein